MTLFNKPPGLLAGLMAVACAMLMSCGGGTDFAAGPGTGGTGTRDGFVTGFGSVYINGEKFDNSQVQPTQAIGANQNANAILALGQRVTIEYDTATGLIKTAQLKPHLVGPVESVDAQTGWLQVLGQAVRVASAQNPYADQPGHITQLVAANGTSANLDDVVVGDWVELHGQWLNNMVNPSVGANAASATGAANGLLASRLQVLGAARSQALLTGQVNSVQGSVGRVSTHDGRELEFDALLNPLTAGQTAQLWVSASDLENWQPSNNTPIKAVAGQARAAPNAISSEGMVIMGTPTAWRSETREMTINGLTLVIPQALLTAELRTALGAQPITTHWQVELTRTSAAAQWRVNRITLAYALPLMVAEGKSMNPQITTP